MTKSKPKSKSQPTRSRSAKAKPARSKSSRSKSKVVLLSGGNPQIAMADGDAPVQQYIAAMPEWKKAVGKRLDALIEKTVPGVKKAVKWNTPLYGLDDGWFLGFHVFARYVKVTFFRGAELSPLPPGPSKDKNTRYYDIYEGALDEAQFVKWVKQAAALPGWVTNKR